MPATTHLLESDKSRTPRATHGYLASFGVFVACRGIHSRPGIGVRVPVIAPGEQRDVRSSRPGRVGGPRLEPDNRVPGRARDKRNPTRTIGAAETDRARGKVAGACQTAWARIWSSMRRPREPARPKSVFGDYASLPDWRIPPEEYRERLAEPGPTHTVRTIPGLVRGRVRAIPTWPPHCSPEQMCPASTICRGPRGSKAHYRRAAAGRRRIGPVPSGGCPIRSEEIGRASGRGRVGISVV